MVVVGGPWRRREWCGIAVVGLELYLGLESRGHSAVVGDAGARGPQVSQSPFMVGERFWKGLKEVLAAFLEHAHIDHPLFQMFGDSICRDHGVAAGSDVRKLASKMLSMPLGPKVQMRRWYTFYDAALDLDPIWHTMLLAMWVWYLSDGQDPRKIVATPEGDEGKPGEEQSYEIRKQTFLSLQQGSHQQLLRSMLICFKHIWTEHKTYSQEAASPKASLEYLQRWACPADWMQRMVKPSMRDALFGKTMANRLGLLTDIEGVSSSILTCPSGDECEEDEQVLWQHLHMVFNMAAQLLMYAIIPQSPPWIFCLLLVPDKQQECLFSAGHLRAHDHIGSLA